jgi:CHAD domain-containing protein
MRGFRLMAHGTTAISGDLARILARHEQALSERLPAAIAGDLKAIHRVRVTSRRVRETLAVAAAVAADRGVARAQHDVRGLTRALGPVREIDVALLEAEGAARRHAWSADHVGAIRQALEAVRERRARTMSIKAGRFDRERFHDRCRKIADRMSETSDREWWRALAARIVQRADLVLGAVSTCGTLYAPDRLHALRIAIKKLRYALEVVGRTPGPDVRLALAALKRAQRRFGHLHDLQVLLAEIQQSIGTSRLAPVPGEYRTIVDALERDCRSIHARILPRLPELRAVALAAKRELAARRRSQRLPMAKAPAPSFADTPRAQPQRDKLSINRKS